MSCQRRAAVCMGVPCFTLVGQAVIGTGLGFEWSTFSYNLVAHLAYHVVEHWVCEIPDPTISHFEPDMSVAQMVSDSGQRRGFLGMNGRDRFGRRLNEHVAGALR